MTTNSYKRRIGDYDVDLWLDNFMCLVNLCIGPTSNDMKSILDFVGDREQRLLGYELMFVVYRI